MTLRRDEQHVVSGEEEEQEGKSLVHVNIFGTHFEHCSYACPLIRVLHRKDMGAYRVMAFGCLGFHRSYFGITGVLFIRNYSSRTASGLGR